MNTTTEAPATLPRKKVHETIEALQQAYENDEYDVGPYTAREVAAVLELLKERLGL